jgi:hypothetical protein
VPLRARPKPGRRFFAEGVVWNLGPVSGRRMDIRPLSLSEPPVPAAVLARWLIGKPLVREHRRGRMSGRIVETEALS